MATADDIIEAFLRGVAEGAKQSPSSKSKPKKASKSSTKKPTDAKKPRKVPAYSKKYGKNFQKVQGKYKKKDGSWKQDGFKRAQAEAHRLTKKEMK